MATRLINKEWNDIMMNRDAQHIKNLVMPSPEDIFTWEATIEGPRDTQYEHGLFKIEIRFPSDYPFKPPKLRFITPVYHCNINKRGQECLDVGGD